MHLNTIISNLTPYQGNKTLIKYSQSVGDIMTGILQTHNLYAADYDKISNTFWKGSAVKTAKCIYDFLKANTHYIVEPDNKQTLRSPSAILLLGNNKNNGLDCKSYSLFIAGVLDSLKRSGKKINWCYRFASYRPADKLPHHVFVVLNPNTDKEIFVDPVLSTFNNRKTFFFKIDKKPMALIAVSGIGAKRSKADRKARKEQRKAKIKTAIKKRGKILMKFNPVSVSGRNSFLLVVKVNLFGLANKLRAAYEKDQNKVNKFWLKMGGSIASLKKAINEGIKRGKNKGSQESIQGIGVVPAIAAAIAAATPIIIKVTQLLKSIGVNTDDLAAGAKKLVSNIIEKKIDQQAEAEQSAEDQSEDSSEQSAEDQSEDSSEQRAESTEE